MELDNGYYFKMKKSTYRNELIKSMTYLAKNRKTVFLGQSVEFSGNAIYNTLSHIKKNRKIELPVFEDVQMGMSIGMAISGYIPVTCYPRFDFLILAMNQLVNHLDKMRYMSEGQFKPQVIIRTSIGSKKPLDGGVQHTQDYSKMFRSICTEINIVILKKTKDIFTEYKKAIDRKDKKSTLLIEYGDYYNKK